MLTRRTLVAVGPETTYGTVAVTYQILAYDVDLDVIGEKLDRTIVRDSFEIRGHAAGSDPEMHALLQGCGFGTGAHSDTAEITYSLQSVEDAIHSTSIVVYKDGTQHTMLGCRGSVKFIFEAGKYGIAEWNFQGLYQGTGVAMTTPDLAGVDTTKPPIVYNSSFQIAGFSPICSKCEIDVANEIQRRDDLSATYGVKSFALTGRKPTMVFRADAVVESSNPFWGDWAGNVVDTFGINAGSAPQGEQVYFSGYFQYESNKYADDGGQSVYDCNAALVSSDVNSQNDELVIRFGLSQ